MIDQSSLLSDLFLICGPCVIEEGDVLDQVAEKLVELREKTGAFIVFKSSYDKANRTSLKGFRGPGVEKGVERLLQIKEKYKLPVLTDVHTAEEAEIAGATLDCIQIPAFLCRQTDLILAACESKAWVNIKKGQFLAPWDMEHVVKKVDPEHQKKLMLTERGTSFGYNMLVSDMRSIPQLRSLGFPVVFDGTHSVQMPGGLGGSSGGQRQYVSTLSKSAVAAGANGFFWEAHPDPDNAPSDGPNMLPLEQLEPLFTQCKSIYDCVNEGN